MNYLIICIIVLIIFLLLMRIRLRIVYHNNTNVDLFISRIFNIKIDVDKIITEKYREAPLRTGIDNFLKTWGLIFEEKKFFKGLAKRSIIKKLTLIPRKNIEDPILNVYLVFLQWQLVSYIQLVFDRNFIRQRNRYYQVIIKNEESNETLSGEIEIETRVFYLLYLFIKYPKSGKRIFLGGKKHERSSN